MTNIALSNRRFIPASEGFNRRWTVIESIKHRVGGAVVTVGWRLTCECHYTRDFTEKHFIDPYGVVIIARDSHGCLHEVIQVESVDD